MGLGQTMLTSMFLVLLSLAAISANRLILDRESSYYEEEAYKQSAILANALLQEIVRKKYDSGVVDTSNWGYQDKLDFNQPYDLGPNPTARDYVNPGGVADTFPYKSIIATNGNYFDDIDDYKGYKRSASAGNLSGFILTVDVYYVKKSGASYIPSTGTYNQQYQKQVNVTVSNPKYLRKNLLYSTIVSY